MAFLLPHQALLQKGETVADTIRMISCFADICAMRHPKEGAALVASEYSSIPVINAGDGGHQHPTQTLTDLMTIRSLKGRLEQHEDRSLRRLEIWTYRTFTDPCTGALSGNRIRPYFSGRTSSSKLHATGCTG